MPGGGVVLCCWRNYLRGGPCSWRATAGVSLAVRASATAGNGVLQRLGLGGVAVAASGARGASAYIEQRRGRKEDA